MNFPDKIRKIIKNAGYNYKIKVFPRGKKYKKNGKIVIQEYDKIVVYAGWHIKKLAQKRSMRLVAWKEDGKWQGDMDVVANQGGKGDRIFIKDYHDKTEPLKYTMFSNLSWNDNEQYAKQQLLKILENWRKMDIENRK